MDDQSRERALTRAQRRLAGAMPGSPEWAAAIEEVEELQRATTSGWSTDRQPGDRRALAAPGAQGR